jgi:hypothetical protein
MNVADVGNVGTRNEEDENMSLINALLGNMVNTPAPVAGLGVTELGWTDRHAGTITRVSPNGKRLWFTLDIATRTDANGMSESQTYTYAQNPSAQEREARLCKNGWKIVGSRNGLSLGRREKYHDYSF